MSMDEFIGIIMPSQEFFQMIYTYFDKTDYIHLVNNTLYSSYRKEWFEKIKCFSKTDFTCEDCFNTPNEKKYMQHFMLTQVKPILTYIIQCQYIEKLTPYFSTDILKYCLVPYLDIPNVVCKFSSVEYLGETDSLTFVSFGLLCKTIYINEEKIPSTYVNPRGLNHILYSPIIDNCSDINQWCKYLKYVTKCFKQYFNSFHVPKKPKFYRIFEP